MRDRKISPVSKDTLGQYIIKSEDSRWSALRERAQQNIRQTMYLSRGRTVILGANVPESAEFPIFAHYRPTYELWVSAIAPDLWAQFVLSVKAYAIAFKLFGFDEDIDKGKPDSVRELDEQRAYEARKARESVKPLQPPQNLREWDELYSNPENFILREDEYEDE